jgi:crotonobetainyl-CoA:carnitine CoA-transferase CaiB-like acyl-CoA transferase
MAAAECDHIWQRSGNAIGGGAPMNTYRTADDHWLCLFAPFEKQWQALCGVMGKPELAADPRCKDWDARVQNAQFVDLEVAAWIATQTAEQAEATLEAADIVAARVMDFGEIVNFPHYIARDMIVKAEHQCMGPSRTTAWPPSTRAHPAACAGRRHCWASTTAKYSANWA